MQQSTSLHVAIIMDGNGRWATRRGLPRPAGHRAGVAAVRRVVAAPPGLGLGPRERSRGPAFFLGFLLYAKKYFAPLRDHHGGYGRRGPPPRPPPPRRPPRRRRGGAPRRRGRAGSRHRPAHLVRLLGGQL